MFSDIDIVFIILLLLISIYGIYRMCRIVEKDTEQYNEEKNKPKKREYWYIIYMKLPPGDTVDAVIVVFFLVLLVYTIYRIEKMGDRDDE